MPQQHSIPFIHPPSTPLPNIPNVTFLPPKPTMSQNPCPLSNTLYPTRNLLCTRIYSVLNSKGATNGSSDCNRYDGSSVAIKKSVDVATLGNLCVDIVLNVPKLPPTSLIQRKAYMDQLAKSPPDKKYWEAGGNCNMAIAAARLGLRCVTIGHVGNEIYGKFIEDVLTDEGIDIVGVDDQHIVNRSLTAADETLICWVLVDPLHQHGFCSRGDFCKEPALSWMTNLSTKVKNSIKQSKILFCNGYGFDDLPPGVFVSAVEYAVEVGTSVFFDPGPRGTRTALGTPEEQRALCKLLQLSNVLLLTMEEAESLTGIKNPILAGQELLRKGIRTKCVIVKMGPRGSILITMSTICCAPAFKVNVIDTVGCGDSFVAAIAFGFIHKVPLINTLTIANAVGGATAMGCGAGRNVASLEQVLDLMKGSNINEDDKFWKDILGEHLNGNNITMLSKSVVNGSSKLNCVPLQKVVSEMLPKLETKAVEKVAQF
ncbi:hypothetical protein LIER_01623 [Lithospermum erythrorhizon]|uniref:Carbohydrate kinase PfkB domain-containing protein n=1 Tax=Lithospermum erythrorhizon TaxID=34254 RepID=A0AAV3NM23_LITER